MAVFGKRNSAAHLQRTARVRTAAGIGAATASPGPSNATPAPGLTTAPAETAAATYPAGEKVWATVLFDRPVTLDGSALTAGIARHFPSKLFAASYTGPASDGGHAISIGHAGLAILPIDPAGHPHVPKALENNCLWNGAESAVQRARGGVMICGVSLPQSTRQQSRCEQALLASNSMTVMAATLMLELPGALALVWHAADHLSPPDRVVSVAEGLADGTVDPSLWVGMRIVKASREATELCATTQGLTAFIGGEMAHVPESVDPASILARTMWCTCHVIVNGLPETSRTVLPLTESESVEILVGPQRGAGEPFIYLSGK